MTVSELQRYWYRRHGSFFARRFRLMLARHTWGKSINTPVTPTDPGIGVKTCVLMNDMLTIPEFHELLTAEAVAWRQELHRLYKIRGSSGIAMPVASTDIELIKAQEALLHTFQHGLDSLEPASVYEIEQLHLAERRLRS